MRRLLFVVAISCTLVVATDAWSGDDPGGANFGATTIILPKHLFDVQVDVSGKITSSAPSPITIAHADPGTFCHKVTTVDVTVNGSTCSQYATPSKKEPNLCNFNATDATFTFPYPGAPSGCSYSVDQAILAGCVAGATEVAHPLSSMGVLLLYSVVSGPISDTFRRVTPGIGITCAPCPLLTAPQSQLELAADVMQTVDLSKLVTGGVAPYTVQFTAVPSGMVVQGNSMSGRPALGTYDGSLTVKGSC